MTKALLCFTRNSRDSETEGEDEEEEEDENENETDGGDELAKYCETLSEAELGVILCNHLRHVTGMPDPIQFIVRLQQLVVALLHVPYPTLHASELASLLVRPGEFIGLDKHSTQVAPSFRYFVNPTNPNKSALAIQLSHTKTNQRMANGVHHPITFISGVGSVRVLSE